MANQEAKKNQKEKRSTAQKRDLQNEKKRLNNKIYKSRVRTAIRSLDDAIDKKEPSAVQAQLNEVYSILDKCVKRGVFKINKAARTKSRLTARVFAKV